MNRRKFLQSLPALGALLTTLKLGKHPPYREPYTEEKLRKQKEMPSRIQLGNYPNIHELNKIAARKTMEDFERKLIFGGRDV